MSKIIAGVILAGVGTLVGSYLSEACTNEILTKITPFLSALPGLAMAYMARVKMGGVNALGGRIG